MLRNFIKYLSGDMLARAIGIISLPIYTYFITPQEYGLFSIILSYIALSTFLFTFNVHTSIGRFFYEKDIDLNSFMSTTLILTALLFIIVSSVVLLINDDFLESLLGFDFSFYESYFYLLVFSSILFLIYIQVLIPQKKGKEYSILVVTQSYSRFFITVIFFYFIEATALRMLQAILITDILINLYIFWKLKHYFRFKFSKSDAKYILNYSVLLIPYAISGVVLAQIDRVMIGNILGERETGIYSIGYVFGSIPLMLFGALSNAWMPKYFSCMNDKKHAALDKDVIFIVYILAVALVFFSSYIGFFLSFILSDNYQISLQYIPLIAMSMFFAIMWNIWGRGIGYAKKTMWTSVVGIISAVANVYLNSIIIPLYGLNGAVYATYISYMLMAFLGYGFARYLLGIYTTSFLQLKIPMIIIFAYSLGYLFFKETFLYIMCIVLPFVFVVLYFKKKNEVDGFLAKF